MRIQSADELGIAIRELRLARGLDQAALAMGIGVSRRWVIEIEQGKERAEVGLVLRALRFLDAVVAITPRATTTGQDAV